MRRILLVVFLIAIAAAGVYAFALGGEPSRADFIAKGKQYDVRILRDTWGVPHIFGKTDADTAYGLAYAHCEDDMPTIIESLLTSRGKLASVKGKDSAPIDFMVALMRVWPTVDAKYETDLSPETRAVCEAYADGINHYAALHPSEVSRGVLPITGKDIVAGFVFKAPFFFGVDNAVQELFRDTRRREVSGKNPAKAARAYLTDDLPVGSNTFAVSPKRSADGSTFININSHQPWEGPVAWYEAHVHSEQGWNAVGGVFPGTPVILHGHNPNLGWAHTVNKPDLVDIYVLEMNPENPSQYKFDGAWRDLEVAKAPIKIKLWGPISWTFKREILWSVYGPAVRQKHGVYAIRYAGLGDIRAVEQWYRMDKARNLDEWKDAMRMQAIPSFNCAYADREGNILYVYNARFPKRAEGYDWRKYLPGNTSETLWTEYLPWDATPQVENPESGFVLNCNSTPYRATLDPENPKPENYSKSLGIETHMSNRALRAMELLSADTSITEEEFYAYKYDMAYSKESEIARLWEKMKAATSDDPLTSEALTVVRAWDLNTNPENTSAAITLLTISPGSDNETQSGDLEKTLALLKSNAHALKEHFGKIDVPWSEVNRLYRGKVNMGIGGGPDELHAVYGFRVSDGKLEGLENGQVHGRAGDCYILIASWDKDGKLHSRAIHQYGSATSRPESPHYADQVPLFVARETRPVWFDEADIRANLEREYRPGEEVGTIK
ncbi:MAG: acylase [Candidatus Hydrogenedentales bacterium]|jgi:penicillin amidase/acyl-homoserine-lactone acylase